MTGICCIFCLIASGKAPAKIVREWDDAVAFIPLNPVVDGHVLVIPKIHVADFLESPEVSSLVMRRVAELASNPCNIIASVGEEATQSVFHLHVHVVPRRIDDGLILPWTNKSRTKP